MSDLLASLFNAFDRGRLSRRQLLQALGVAAALRPASAFAQGQCGGAQSRHARVRPDAGEAAVRATGWKTVLLDHFSCQVRRLREGSGLLPGADELEDSQRRRQAGDARHRRLGRPRHSRRIRGASAAAGSRRRPPAAAAAGAVAGAAAARAVPRAPRKAAFDGFCWGIDPWDAKKVEAELKKRGLRRSPTTTATSRAST